MARDPTVNVYWAESDIPQRDTTQRTHEKVIYEPRTMLV